MLGNVEVALRRERSAEEYRQVLHNLRSQIVRVQQIIEALLFLARADREAPLPDREIFDLRKWVAAHLRDWSSHPRAADLKVDTNDASQVHVPLLAQLFDNLLDNGCKYSEPGTPITIRGGGDGECCRLSIEDAGCGINAAELPRVFEPFYRSSRSRRNGTGLGLAVAQRIAFAFGGRIDVSSREERGTIFTLALPRVSGSVAEVVRLR